MYWPETSWMSRESRCLSRVRIVHIAGWASASAAEAAQPPSTGSRPLGPMRLGAADLCFLLTDRLADFLGRVP
ncbi:hypothetical protein K32_25400 [Kaistia sp. 32K]|nr:hypothetical protein K32_25400 [Kaistia sp. 32K]